MKQPCLLGPTPKQFEAICSEINEDPDKLKTNLRLLKEWVDCQPHLPKNYEPELLTSFLRGCKHNLERAKRKIDAYFTAKATATDIFGNLDPFSNDYITASRTYRLATLPKLTPDGYRITFHKITDCDSSLFSLKDIARILLMQGELRLVEETAIAGDMYIFDIQHMTLGHYTRLVQPALIARLLTLAQHAYPQRLARIHVVNAPNHVYKTITLFGAFMKEKMRNRFLVHPDLKSLHSHVPPECLPSDYEGTLSSLQDIHDAWVRKLEEKKPWFVKEQNIKADLKKKVNIGNNSGDSNMFGTEGAFRKLTID